jgi:Spx/MgsR family transcriptional regulator
VVISVGIVAEYGMISLMEPHSITLYGIPNCDTVKKARIWLDTYETPHQFFDFKKQGVPEQRLAAWVRALGWEPLVNTRGTTWRKLDEATRALVIDAPVAIALMQASPSVIKRPVVEWADGSISVGFDDASWRQRLGLTGHSG